MANPRYIPELEQTDPKAAVRDFWNSDPCGARYLAGREDFDAHARARFTLEPYIPEFAQFAESRGRKVLEIGVGMGADYLEWLKAGAQVTGIDMSAVSLERARRRCIAAGFQPDLRLAEAEQLPFPDDSFDVVYSYGVMHHSPNPAKCVREALRVLRPGGTARIMLYHHPSLTGLMLWLRYGALRGQSLRRTVHERLESPGTKTYKKAEVLALMNGFEDVSIRQVFSPGDLLLHRPSAHFRSWIYRPVWMLYPRFLARKFARRWGLFLLIAGRKPGSQG